MNDYTTEPEPELSPEDEALIADLFDFVDTYPPDHFIKVYPRRLRDFCRNVIAAARIKHQKKNIKITRAQIGALVLLGLRIDKEGYCFPSQESSAKQIGMKSGSGSRYIHQVLERFDMIESEIVPERRSRRYKLPLGIFVFGKDYYRVQKFATPYDQKFASEYDQKFAQNKKPDSLTRNQESDEQTNIARSAAPSGDNAESQIAEVQQRLYNDLISVGIAPKEAAIITIQYKSKTIDGVISDARRLTQEGRIHNPGAWARKAIEKRDNVPIQYAAFGGLPSVQALLTSHKAASQPQSPQSPHNSPLPSSGEHQRLMARALSRAGVRTLEACLIASQYKPEIIQAAIEQSLQKRVGNRGAWIRGYVERVSNTAINYGLIDVAQPIMAAMEELPNSSPYLIDPYDDDSVESRRKAAQDRAQLEAGAWETD